GRGQFDRANSDLGLFSHPFAAPLRLMDNLAPVREGVHVQVRGLRKTLQRQVVLADVDLSVEAGEIFVVMGPSGSGKTMLLKHVIGLEKSDAGEILINGQSLASSPVMESCRMAMVFQSSALLNSLTVGENVGLYLREHRLKPEA